MMERFYSLNTILRHERAGERVQPMRDRIRMMEESKKEEQEGGIINELWEHGSHHSDGSEATVGSNNTDMSMLSFYSNHTTV